MSLLPPVLAGLCAALVAVVMGYRLALPHLAPPVLLRLAVADGAAMIATAALAAVLVIGAVALTPPDGVNAGPVGTTLPV
jgi:hypothetical protein